MLFQSKIFVLLLLFLIINHVSNILHVPHAPKKLLSVNQFCRDNNVYFEFHPSCFHIKDRASQKILLTGPSSDGLYTLHTDPPFSPHALSATKVSMMDWHHRLGHPHSRVLHQIISKNSLGLSSIKCFSDCIACHMGKACRFPLLENSFVATKVLDLVVCDVWGPAPIISFTGHKYYVLFVDAYSKFS